MLGVSADAAHDQPGGDVVFLAAGGERGERESAVPSPAGLGKADEVNNSSHRLSVAPTWGRGPAGGLWPCVADGNWRPRGRLPRRTPGGRTRRTVCRGSARSPNPAGSGQAAYAA